MLTLKGGTYRRTVESGVDLKASGIRLKPLKPMHSVKKKHVTNAKSLICCKVEDRYQTVFVIGEDSRDSATSIQNDTENGRNRWYGIFKINDKL